MQAETTHYLLILSDSRAIAWVIAQQRMAFPSPIRAEVSSLKLGDELFIYTTRGAFGNPTRDRGRVVGRAIARTSAQHVESPIQIANREFGSACDIDIHQLSPWGRGVELAPLVERLDAFPVPTAWSWNLRRPLMLLPYRDASILRTELSRSAVSVEEAAPTYAEYANRR
ncbi:hypothetical protein GCM10009850_068850 [Nonomuraea monospora]|uniref:EVE domain-containing protein n=1 Tax=Nonomuraea monospora TaxID=568818 RepID=A0ABP5PI56_9ACTN